MCFKLLYVGQGFVLYVCLHFAGDSNVRWYFSPMQNVNKHREQSLGTLAMTQCVNLFVDHSITPGGSTCTNCVTMLVREFSERGTFSEWGSDLSRSEIRVSFLDEMWNKGTFLATLFISQNYLGIFLTKIYPCSSYSKMFMIPFRDKGINSLIIL